MKKIPRARRRLATGQLNVLLCMKLTLLLTVFFTFQVSAKVFSQDSRLSVKFEKTDIAHALKLIEKKTEFRFLYNDALLSPVVIDQAFENEKLSVILTNVLSNTGLAFHQVNSRLIVIGPAGMSTKDITAKGSAADADNGTVLPGVTVQVKNSRTGTVTDDKGNFSLTVPENAVLVISYVGYVSQEVTATAAPLSVRLQPASTGLNQVVVIGYGSREKKDVTTSISNIDSKQIGQSVTMSPEYAMQGRMTGVQVSGNSGNPIDRPTIRIRGVNTWGVADPLYVIDGIPVTELGGGIEGQEDARVADVRGPLNIMSMINPNDIESISVLKDASAAAIYGVRAANGVILITTKKGVKGTPSVDFSARYGVQQIVKTWNTLSTPEFVNFYKQSYAVNPSQTLDPWFDPTSAGYLGNTKETYDWQKPLINKSAPTQDYALRVSGGSEKADYNFSLGYTNAEGTLVHQGLERYTVGLKVNAKVTDWFNTGINYRLAYVQGDNDNTSNLEDRALTPPWQPVYGSGPAFLKGYAAEVPGYDASGNWSTAKLYGDGTRINVLGQMALNTTDYHSIRNLGSYYAEIKPIKNLSIKGTVSADYYVHSKFQFIDYNSNWFDYTGYDPKSKGGGTSVGQYGERQTYNFNLIKEVSVNYTQQFGLHHVDLLLDGMDQRYNAKYSAQTSDYMPFTDRNLWDFNADNLYTNLQSNRYAWALQGQLGRVSYNYNSKYYLDATLRHDGSSRFAPGNRWGWFPSLSAAWRLTAEPFLKSVPWLNDLKLRAGWGQLGNQEVRNYAYLSTIALNPQYAFGSQPGGNGLGNYALGAAGFYFPNPAINWEKTSSTNIGIDAVLFGKLNVTADYYDKRTTGILQPTPVPPSIGSKYDPIANIASVKNSGIELSVSYQGNIGELGYNVSGNITTVKNEVLSTFNGVPITNTDANGVTTRIEAGQSLGYLYGFKAGSIFQNDQDATAYDAAHKDAYAQKAHAAGDLSFQDINGAPDGKAGNRFYTKGADGKVDDYDRTNIGKTIPGYYYGFNLGLNYKGIDVLVALQGVGDVYKYDFARTTLMNTGTRGSNLLKDALNAWTPENHSTTVARAQVNDPLANGRFSSWNVEKAGYLRLGTAQAGYTLPAGLYNRMKNTVKSLRIYVAVSNGFLITRWKGLDPENDLNPAPRTYSFGISGRF